MIEKRLLRDPDGEITGSVERQLSPAEEVVELACIELEKRLPIPSDLPEDEEVVVTVGRVDARADLREVHDLMSERLQHVLGGRPYVLRCTRGPAPGDDAI